MSNFEVDLAQLEIHCLAEVMNLVRWVEDLEELLGHRVPKELEIEIVCQWISDAMPRLREMLDVGLRERLSAAEWEQPGGLQ